MDKTKVDKIQTDKVNTLNIGKASKKEADNVDKLGICIIDIKKIDKTYKSSISVKTKNL